MSEATNPARHNQNNPLPEGHISQYMDRVLSEAGSLEASERLLPVGDHLIGAMLRSQGLDNGVATVKRLSRDAGKPVTDPNLEGKKHAWMVDFTKSDGLRRTLLDIGEQPGGELLFYNLDSRVGISETGRPVMTNMDQITAYLNTSTDAEKALTDSGPVAAWQTTIAGEVTKFLQVKGRKEAWDARGNLGSEISSVRHDQQQWESAAALAQRAGVDMQLIAESAQWMLTQQEAGRPVAQAPVIEPAPDYSSLLN